MIRIDVAGTEEVRAELARIGTVLTQKALAKTADDLEEYIDHAADRHTKTGALRRSIFNRKVGNGYEIGHDLQKALYAKWVVKGSRPHVIRPKEGGSYKSYKTIEGKATRKGIAKGGAPRQFLRWAIGGRFIFAREVHHPGYAGDDYISRAARLAPRMFAIHVNTLLNEG